jgi:hypothetical protein
MTAPGHVRGLATRFGQVSVTRIAYRARGRANLHPADAALNLPVEKHSHGLRRLAAIEAARGSYADTASAIERATGVRLGRRQVEGLAARAAADVDACGCDHPTLVVGSNQRRASVGPIAKGSGRTYGMRHHGQWKGVDVNDPNWHQPQHPPPWPPHGPPQRRMPPPGMPYGPPSVFPQVQRHPVFRPVQQYPQQHPGAEIAITAKASPFVFPVGPLIYLMRVRAVVDGQLRYLPWGRFILFVPPGQHHLRLFLNYRLIRGAAPMQVAEGLANVNLVPGQRLELEYRAPWVVLVPGALGPAPQPRRALWLWLVLTLVTLGCIAGLVYDNAVGGG